MRSHLFFAQVTCLVTDWIRGKMVTGDRKGNIRVWDLQKVFIHVNIVSDFTLKKLTALFEER